MASGPWNLSSPHHCTAWCYSKANPTGTFFERIKSKLQLGQSSFLIMLEVMLQLWTVCTNCYQDRWLVSSHELIGVRQHYPVLLFCPCLHRYHSEQTLLVKLLQTLVRAVGCECCSPPSELLPVPLGWRWGWVGVFCSAWIPAWSIPPSLLCPSDCLICCAASDCPNPLLPMFSSLWGLGKPATFGVSVAQLQQSQVAA